MDESSIDPSAHAYAIEIDDGEALAERISYCIALE